MRKTKKIAMFIVGGIGIILTGLGILSFYSATNLVASPEDVKFAQKVGLAFVIPGVPIFLLAVWLFINLRSQKK